jgi:chorismate dehydratase
LNARPAAGRQTAADRQTADQSPPKTSAVRLGAVSYLNARPLTVALASDGADRQTAADREFELSYHVPSACSAELAAGRIDAGLIPAIAYARSDIEYHIVPDVAIGCFGEVLTVRLFYRGALDSIRTIAADRSSQTSVGLLRILMREKYGLDPTIQDAAPDLDAMLHGADAALLIGDPVLPLVEADPQSDRRSLDLGKEWLDLTGHVFVFAFWAAREGALEPQQVESIVAARRLGEARIAEIAGDFQRQRAGSCELYERYLRDHIHYGLEPRAVSGLTEFYRLACAHDVIDNIPELRFYQRG